MAQRLRFILDGDDQLSRVLNHAGDSSALLHRRLNDDMDANSRAVNQFVRHTDGRLRDLRGRFVSAADASRLLGSGMPDLTRRLGDVGTAGGDAAASLGRSGGGLSGALIGVAAVAGMSLLPAIGAVVPAMAGAAVAAGTLKLGFAGVADALDAQTKGQKEYAEALKKLPKPAQDFTKALVGLKGEFSGIGKKVQAAMLPGFTKAVQAAGPVVKILGRSMTDLGGAFGKAAEGVGRLLKDSGFQADLQTNLKLGTQFIQDMTAALGPLVRSVLDFGAASGPTLKAFTDGITGLLTKGVPGFFEGLTPGIGGAAKMLDGLFSAVNSLLPAIGRLAGEMGRTLGPIFGETFRILGDAGASALDALAGGMKALSPVFKDLAFGLKTITDLGAIIGPTMADTGLAIMGAFAPIGDEVNNAVGPLQRLNQWINDNKIGILEIARIFGSVMIDMTGAAIQAVPPIIRAWKMIAVGVLESIGIAVSASAKLWGWVPGIGGKLKDANRAFDRFKDGYIGTLNTAEKKASDFAAAAGPKLAAGKLKLDINNWSQQLAEAKRKLASVPPSKQAALKATIRDLEAKVASAKRQLNSLDGKTAHTYIYSTKVNTTIYRTKGSLHDVVGGYASGGRPEAGEVAWVGEDGPELMRFRGGEEIYDHRTSMAMLRGAPTAGMGMDAGRGLVQGLLGSQGLVQQAAARMAAAVTAGVRTELEIASPSKKMRALAKDIGAGLIKGLTGSRDKIKAVAADLAKDIRAAFSGRKESSLIRMVDRQTKRLLDAAAKRDKIAATIAAAKRFASDVTGNAREGAGLANLGLEPEQVTAGRIKAGLASKLAQIKQFTKYIDILAKKGLNKGLLRQILNMGPEAGYAYASALVGADKATFASINSLQTQIDKSTTTLGQVGADRLYDSGKNASKGFLKGLESQQKDIENLMLKIAKGMEKAIKRALGIKSPSTVMARLGAYSTEGLARGLVDGMPVLDRSLAAVAGRVSATRPVIGRPAVTGRGGGVMQVQVDVHGATDPVATAREIRRQLLELKRVHGLNISLGVA
ncbi:hypothetical protein [Streptomyces sp. NPDC007264]|uniref:hypothetical protein n=1 Tax=Streptomyces sp. NPDC007264 TaxID=3364777 RepID=UPI0036DA3424